MEGLLYEADQISQKLEQKGVKKNCEKIFFNWRIKRSSKEWWKREEKSIIQEKIQEVKGMSLQIIRALWVPSTTDEKEPIPNNHWNFRILYSRKG